MLPFFYGQYLTVAVHNKFCLGSTIFTCPWSNSSQKKMKYSHCLWPPTYSQTNMALGQNLVALVNINIAGIYGSVHSTNIDNNRF